MATQSTYDPIQAAFQNVVREFKASVKDDVYQQILAVRTIDDLYKAIEELQEKQAKEGRLRHLSKIKPFLDNLEGYAEVIEVFLQVKPDVIALIWGPIKLVLQWTSVLNQSFDAITRTLSEVGVLLPEFKNMVTLFKDNSQIKDVLLLFFRDILDLHTVALQFFSLRRWKLVFESMWPRHRERIKVVMKNIERHTLLFRNEVRLEHIQEEHEARTRALQHFEAAEKAHCRQEYQAIKTDVSPKGYESKLDWLRGRVCAGTEQWLTSDATFKKWIDGTEKSANFLWLQGIPGAGKTFLSGLVVSNTIHVGKTAYVFLSYNQVESTSALSVLHSLLFQLATEDEGVQEILSRSSRETLKSDIDGVVDLLTTAINTLAPVFLIVDGLDEIEVIERSRLLQKLLHVCNSCDDVRVFVSSRAENDIKSALKGKPSIRVDNQNTASIQHFVQESTDQWFAENDFPTQMQSEIRTLLKPLPSSSKGMFLYAKLILSSISNLDEIEDIKSELRVLPESLDDAYARIFSRVNTLDQISKAKARRLLGWVGCSPTPLSIQELEAALLIKYDGTRRDPQASGRLNVTKLCGPIVEVVDEFVQFVHFTVKEYIFSPKIPNHIDMSNATLGLALSCLFYLRQSHHDGGIKDDEIAERILDGSYRLHNLATTTWYTLVETYLSSIASEQISSELLKQLNLFMEGRITDPEEDQKFISPPPALRSIESRSPDIYRFLCSVRHYLQVMKGSSFSIDKDNWSHLDPTSLSQLTTRIHLQLNRLLCRSHPSTRCKCASLERHYGARPFKCSVVSCSYHRHGFVSHALRRTHVKQHEHPWTCEIPGCEFFDDGFLSRKMRDEHRNLYHGTTERITSSNVEVDGDTDDLRALLIDLIEAGENDHVQLLLIEKKISMPQYNGNRGSYLNECSEDIPEAAGRASVEMFKILNVGLKFGSWNYHRALAASIRANNLPTFSYIATHVSDYSSGKEFGRPLDRTKFSEISLEVFWRSNQLIFDEWYAILKGAIDTMTPRRRKHGLLWGRLLSNMTIQPMRRHWLYRLLKLLIDKKFIEKDEISNGLAIAAQNSASIEAAELCTDLGADVDWRIHGRYRTPLQHALRRSSIEAAEMSRFLLLKGADPCLEAEATKTKMRDENCARDMYKWLGVTWDELVAETAVYRSAKTSDGST